MMLDLGQQGTGIRIEVIDNGHGIDAEDRDHLFEPFFTTKAKGTGLGLAIVKRILDQHGGTIQVSPNDPQGTRITVVLPVNPKIDPSPLQDATESVEP